MCLFIAEQHINPDGSVKPPLIAAEDMQVYKVINWDNTSRVFEHYYDKWEILPEVNLIPRETWINSSREQGFDRGDWSIDAGYHAYLGKHFEYTDPRDWSLPCKLVQFVIPAGAKFYFGRGGQVVANKIISGNLSALQEPAWHKFKRKHPRIARWLSLFGVDKLIK